jgi:hypothetical protein
MAASEVICVVAASLWIVVVLAAAAIGCVVLVKFRRRRRKVNRLFDVVRVPIQIGTQGVLLLRRCVPVTASVRPIGRETHPARTRRRSTVSPWRFHRPRIR